jgi:hypothetical protein
MTTPLAALTAPEGLSGSLRSGRALAGETTTPLAALTAPEGLSGSLRSGRALAWL